MTLSDLHDRDAVIDGYLASARRETLILAIASFAIDDDSAAIASARLRWAIDAARDLILDSDSDSEPRMTRHVNQLDRIANRAQRWLVTEPARSLPALGGLVDRVARRPRSSPAVDARGVSLVDLDLDGLALERIALRGASLTSVTARHAHCDGADARASHWRRCELDGASLVMAVFSGGILEHCSLARARLAGTSWHRATVSHGNLVRADLSDARLDRAMFAQCNLRGADLSIIRGPAMASLDGAQFIGCDLRETNWRGRELGGARFIDCKLFGAHGAPELAGAEIERADVSLLGDGSQLATPHDVSVGWRTIVGAGHASARHRRAPPSR